MGCVLSTAIACLLCNNRCSIGRVVSSFAFFPPKPASYCFEEEEGGRLRLRFTDPEMQAAADRMGGGAAGIRVEAHVCETSRKERVALLHFIHPAARATLIWSHGNAMDIGEMYVFLWSLASRLRVSIVAYDYAGYGASTGTPSEADVYADIQAAYEYVCRCGVEPSSHLVLYGQSIGSAPSLWLATRRSVASVVLHTPLLSGLRVLIPPHNGSCTVSGCCSPLCVYAMCDPFPNRSRIRHVSCPVLLMHGTHDTTIDCSHTAALYARCPERHRREPYILPGAGHDNLVEADPQRYFRALDDFISSAREQLGELPLTQPGHEAPIAPVPATAAMLG